MLVKSHSRPCPPPAAALGRAGPTPCLGSTVELALAEGVQMRCPEGESREHCRADPTALVWVSGCGAMPSHLLLAPAVGPESWS